jgi:hypothetical protein
MRAAGFTGILCALVVLAAPAFAGELEVRFENGLVTIRADDVPASAVLERLRGQVNLMFDADLAMHVTLTAQAVTPAAAVRAVAAAAGAPVEEAPGPVLLVKKPRPAPPPVPQIVEDAGRYYARPAFEYPVEVLRDTPADVSRKADLAGFEARRGTRRVFAGDLTARVLREYLEARTVYRAIAARAGEEVVLPEDVDDRHVRIYVATVEDRYYVEVLFHDPVRSAITHLVYRLEPKRMRVEVMTMFRTSLELPR